MPTAPDRQAHPGCSREAQALLAQLLANKRLLGQDHRWEKQNRHPAGSRWLMSIILATLRQKLGEASPGKQFARPYLKKTHHARRRWLTPIILVSQEADIRRIQVRSQPRQIVHETLSRNIQHKTAGFVLGVAQVVKLLPSKHKALSSNPSTKKKKNNRQSY
jgi:hypothetical protein